MNAVRLHAHGEFRIHDEPEPVPVAGEELLQIKAAGICNSDLHWFTEGGIGDARLENPLLIGHEFSAVTETGERVAVDPAIPCSQCELHQKGHPNLCPQVNFAGHGTQDGALRERMAWQQRCLVTHRFPPEETTEALAPLGDRERLKVVIER